MKQKIFTLAVMVLMLIFSTTVFAAGYWKVADNQVPAYHDSGLTNRTGNEAVYKGDNIYVHQETDRAYEVSYPVGNTGKYKKRWVSKIVFNQTVQPVSRYNYPQLSGDYYLVPDNSSNHAIDVPNNSHNAGTFLQIYWKNNSAAQVFTIQNVGGQWHLIKHKDSGLVINCYYGSNGNGNKVWLYQDDGTPAGHWRFRDLGNGIYNIESQLSGNPFLEVQSNNSFNGAVVQLWQQHTGQAARWKLVKVTNSPAPSGNVALSPSGYAYPLGKQTNFSNGHDFAIAEGTPVYAIESGEAKFYQVMGTSKGQYATVSLGNLIELTCDNGAFAKYAHLKSFEGVALKYTSIRTPGSTYSACKNYGKQFIDSRRVNKGDIIGYVGNIGNTEGNTGVHLHFEFYVNGNKQNLNQYFNR